ncbi:PVL ORF-50-like family protein [Staphylococcus aureus]|uniref:SA1788 family PVL leukocidin-associated protein n=1 Tax=Staphylococcus aureus TaxID=1280 RepID=UPI00085C14CD|nr:SA1788 family PVL leukocidin-associated protein [Staphylococcus aureus]SCT81954.1 PVL ORF-50-like family protein [Staphylococcus aureus]
MAKTARIVRIHDKPYRFSEFEMELIESHGITPGMVSKRVKDGWELHEAMDAPEGMRLSEYREKKTIERLEQARLERKLERQRKKEAELRRKKPHLFNVPQKHSRDPYWFDNTYNQMFKKWQEV